MRRAASGKLRDTCAIEAEPPESLRDEPLNVRVRRLEAYQQVTIKARATDETDRLWESHATFIADRHGMVDADRQIPLHGTYSEVDAMGLLWSMIPVSGGRPENSFRWEGLEPVHVELVTEDDEGAVATTRVRRLAVSEDVRVERLESRELTGTFFYPEDSGEHSAVVVLGGSGGGMKEDMAALLASRGFAALALAYFKSGSLPRELVEIPLEYFDEAISWLRSHPATDGGRVGVAGTSRGGELALLLGSTYPEEIRAVVGYVPSSVAWPGIYLRNPLRPTRPAWTLGGEAVPFVSTRLNPSTVGRVGFSWLRSSLSFRELHERSLVDGEEVEAASIPVERLGGPVLVVSGTEDRIWPSSRFSEMVMERLENRNHPFPRRHLCYEGAGHVIGVPYLPALPTCTPPRGGNLEANAFASADSWSRVVEFLRNNLAQ